MAIDYRAFYWPEQVSDKWAGQIVHRSVKKLGRDMWSLWARGEQMWAELVNADLSQFHFWNPVAVTWRRNAVYGGWYPSNPSEPLDGSDPPQPIKPPQDRGLPPYRPLNAPPWSAVDPIEYVIDSKHTMPWADRNVGYDTNHRVFQFKIGAIYPTFHKPDVGHKCYVKADRMQVIFTGNAQGWKPLARLPQYDKNFEMAIFASYPPLTEKIFVHKVSQPWRLYHGNMDGRVRGWEKYKGDLGIYKNDVLVARARVQEFSTSVTPVGSSDVDFAEGDIIDMRFPAGNKFRPEFIAVSIVGGFI